MNTFTRLTTAALTGAASVCLVAATNPSPALAASLPVAGYAGWEATAPSGDTSSDHAWFTVESSPLTAALVGQTVTITLTPTAGTSLDAATVRLHYGTGKGWTPITTQPVSITRSAASTVLTTKITSAIVGRQVQAYGQVTVTDMGLSAVSVAATVQVGSTRTTTQAVTHNPHPAADPNMFWASPTGGGSGHSATSPASLPVAQQEARTQMGSATGTVRVMLLDGTYRQTSPIQFTAADSGTRGHVMSYEAAPDATPVITGAQQVTGWQPWSGHAGVWRAHTTGAVGNGTRAVFVNGVAASITTGRASDVLGKITMLGDKSGYTVTKDISGWPDLKHTSLRWYGNRDNTVEGISWEGWVDRRSPIESATASTIKMASDFAGDHPGAQQGVAIPNMIENNLRLIGTPGQFYIDQGAGDIYYTPRAGENMASADVELPVAQGLVRGTAVSNLRISEVTFQRDAWGQATNQGWADAQAGVLPTSAMIPGAVQFRGSSNVTLSGDTITQTGGAGVQFYAASTNNQVSGGTISDTGGSAIEVGDVTTGSLSNGNVVTHETIDRPARIITTAPAVMAGYVAHTTISHNQIRHVPYSGVSLGWGWGQANGLADNHIDANHLTDTMNDPQLFDGGAIYVNGTTSAQQRSTISGNWIDSMGSAAAAADQGHNSWNGAASYSALYLDGSASNWDVRNNVAQQLHRGTWLGLQIVAGQVAKHNTVTGTFTDTAAANSGAPTNNTVAGTTVVAGQSMPTAALTVEKGI